MRTGRVAPITTIVLSFFLAVRLSVHASSPDFRPDLDQSGDLWSILVALSYAYLTGGLGFRMVRRLAPHWPSSPAVATALLFGLAATGLVVLAVGLAGQLQAGWLVGIALMLGVLGWRHAGEWVSAIKDSVRQVVPRGIELATVGGAIMLGVVALLTVLALAPITDWDTLMYHLDVPAEWLSAGAVERLPDNDHSGLIGPVQMNYIILLAAGTPHAISLMSVVGFIVLCSAVTWLVSRSVDDEGIPLTLLVLASATAIVLVSADARVEVWGMVAIVTLVSVLFASSSGDRPDLVAVLMGSLGGVAVAIKWTNAPIAGMVGLILILRMSRARQLSSMRAVWVVASTTALVLVPWLAKNYLFFHAPQFPLFGTWEVPVWWQEAGVPSSFAVDGVLRHARQPFNLIDWIFNPATLTIEDSGVFQGLGLLIALAWIPAMVLAPKRVRWLHGVLLLAAAVHVLAVTLYSETTNLRYLLPAVILLAVVGASGLTLLARKSRFAHRLVWTAAVIALLPTAIWASQTVRAGPVAAVVGEKGRWMQEMATLDLFEVQKALSELRAENTVLLFEARGASIQTPVVQDNLNLSWQYLETLDAGEDCPVLDASHMVVNGGLLSYLEARNVDLTTIAWQSFEDFAELCLKRLQEVGPYTVYEFRGDQDPIGQDTMRG